MRQALAWVVQDDGREGARGGGCGCWLAGAAGGGRRNDDGSHVSAMPDRTKREPEAACLDL